MKDMERLDLLSEEERPFADKLIKLQCNIEAALDLLSCSDVQTIRIIRVVYDLTLADALKQIDEYKNSHGKDRDVV